VKEEELGQKNDSSLLTAADLFLAKDFELPYYYGSERCGSRAWQSGSSPLIPSASRDQKDLPPN
jgi:hypothetical protein